MELQYSYIVRGKIDVRLLCTSSSDTGKSESDLFIPYLCIRRATWRTFRRYYYIWICKYSGKWMPENRLISPAAGREKRNTKNLDKILHQELSWILITSKAKYSKLSKISKSYQIWGCVQLFYTRKLADKFDSHILQYMTLRASARTSSKKPFCEACLACRRNPIKMYTLVDNRTVLFLHVIAHR